MSKASGSTLPVVGPNVRLVRRRRTPDHPWAYRGVCAVCGPIGAGWTKSEQAATEEAFDHAIRHVEPTQLELELELPTGRRRRRRRGQA